MYLAVRFVSSWVNFSPLRGILWTGNAGRALKQDEYVHEAKSIMDDLAAA